MQRKKFLQLVRVMDPKLQEKIKLLPHNRGVANYVRVSLIHFSSLLAHTQLRSVENYSNLIKTKDSVAIGMKVRLPHYVKHPICLGHFRLL